MKDKIVLLASKRFEEIKRQFDLAESDLERKLAFNNFVLFQNDETVKLVKSGFLSEESRISFVKEIMMRKDILQFISAWADINVVI